MEKKDVEDVSTEDLINNAQDALKDLYDQVCEQIGNGNNVRGIYIEDMKRQLAKGPTADMDLVLKTKCEIDSQKADLELREQHLQKVGDMYSYLHWWLGALP